MLLADLLLAQEGPRLQTFAERWRAMSAAPTLASVGSTLTFELDGERWQLAVNLAGLRPEGLARMRYDDLRGGAGHDRLHGAAGDDRLAVSRVLVRTLELRGLDEEADALAQELLRVTGGSVAARAATSAAVIFPCGSIQ